MGTINGQAYFARAVSYEQKMLMKLTTGASSSDSTQTLNLRMTKKLFNHH
jgi:hypothetical protein